MERVAPEGHVRPWSATLSTKQPFGPADQRTSSKMKNSGSGPKKAVSPKPDAFR